MEIKYRVLDINPKEHSITVRYFTDKLTEEKLSLETDSKGVILRTPDGYPVRCRTDYNVNIWRTPSPSEIEIIDIIKASAPVDWFKLQEDILDKNVDTSLTSANNLLKSVGTFTVDRD